MKMAQNRIIYRTLSNRIIYRTLSNRKVTVMETRLTSLFCIIMWKKHQQLFEYHFNLFESLKYILNVFTHMKLFEFIFNI